jgi:hypothetical protein
MKIMKTKLYSIGSIALLILFCFIFSNVNSQDVKLTKQELKAAKQAQKYANFQLIDTLLQRRFFVIEANYLENKYGNRIVVSSVLNFIKVDPQKITIQIGSNSGFGSNGLGGVTTEGNFDRMKVYRNTKQLTYSVQLTAMTTLGTYDISLTINSDFTARAILSGFTSDKLVYTGNFVPLDRSHVYKGSNSY